MLDDQTRMFMPLSSKVFQFVGSLVATIPTNPSGFCAKTWTPYSSVSLLKDLCYTAESMLRMMLSISSQPLTRNGMDRNSRRGSVSA